jgi:hypothetical protein
MQAMRCAFPSQAHTFYLLHMQPHRVQPVSLAGIEARWVRNFDALYFAAAVRCTGRRTTTTG